MTSEQADRMTLGWSHEHLARISSVTTASVYLLERMGAVGSDDDRRIRSALDQGLAQQRSDREIRQGLLQETSVTNDESISEINVIPP